MEFSFSEWLENELEEQGMMQKMLAEKTGITAGAISNYVRCVRSPKLDTVNLILDVFGKKIVIVDK